MHLWKLPNEESKRVEAADEGLEAVQFGSYL